MRLYPLTAGPPAATTTLCLAERNRQRTINAGIGLRWPHSGKAQIGVICYIEPLLNAGWVQPVKLAARSLMVDWVLGALADHHRVAKMADSIVDREKHPDAVELIELAWVLKAGDEVAFGKSATTQVVPIVSGHPKELSREYIREIYLADSGVRAQVREAGARDVDRVLNWAASFAASSEGDNDADGSNSNGAGSASSVSLIGRLDADPDLRYLDTGSPVCNGWLLHNDGKQRITAWGSLGEQLALLNKGDEVSVTGSYKQREYNGSTYTDLVASQIAYADGSPLPEKDTASTETVEVDVPF